MSELHYRYLKLTNGENIICKTEDDCSNIYSKQTISITDPVVVNHVRIPRGHMIVETYGLTAWAAFVEETVFSIPTSQIIMTSSINENAKKNYLEFVDQLNSKQNEDVNDDTDREKLAKQLISMLTMEDTNENQEENEDRFRVKGNRTVH
jgi:hypothetical protein